MPELLIKLSKVVNDRDKIEVVAWVALLMGFYMFLRKSNLVPDTMDTFNGQYQFRRADVNLMGLDKAMMFEIRCSRTIQYRQKVLRLPVLPAKNRAICPVFWVHLLVNLVPGESQDPLLLITNGNQKLALSANQLLYRLRKWLILIGQDPTIYT